MCGYSDRESLIFNMLMWFRPDGLPVVCHCRPNDHIMFIFRNRNTLLIPNHAIILQEYIYRLTQTNNTNSSKIKKAQNNKITLNCEIIFNHNIKSDIFQ